MSEQSHPHIADQKLGEDAITTVELAHGETAEFALDSYIEGNQAVETGNGYNGDVVALFELPGTEEEPAKQIALMDFGEIDPNNPPSLLYYKGKPMTPIFGRVQSRYGLVAHNYSPSDHMRAYTPVEMGQSVDVGRGTSVAHELGLDEVERGTEAISRNHFTVILDAKGAQITDHSKNHTKVTYETAQHDAKSKPQTATPAPESSQPYYQGVAAETNRQMAIAAADRRNRSAAGLGARVHSLR